MPAINRKIKHMNTKYTISFILGAVMITMINTRAQTPFTRITTGARVNDPGAYALCSWGDFNNDGFLDLFVAGFNDLTNVFYWNNGNGTFTKATQGDPVRDADYHIAGAAGDYDNDGNLDLLVSAGVGAPTARRSMLYRNNSDGTFSRVSGGGVTNVLGYFGPSVWGDYDKDGFLDLFIANHGDPNDHGGANRLLHNNGDGTFSRVTSGPVVNDISSGYDAAWADYDNDGFPDLLVVNNSYAGNDRMFLYHNERNGSFTRFLTNALTAD